MLHRLTNRSAWAALLALLACFLAPRAAWAQEVPPGAAGPQRQSAPISENDEGRKVLGIEVVGNRRWSASQLIAGLGQRVGEPLGLDRIDRGLALLFETFHVRAQVFRQDTPEGIWLRLQVTELPSDLEPRFIGNDKIDDEELLEWAGLGARTEVYIPEVPRIRQRLIDRYRQKGYAFAEVNEVVRGGGEGDEFGDVIFEIREGPRVHVKELVVHGNQSLPDKGMLFWKDGLRHLSKVQSKGPSLFDWNGKPFIREVLEADLVAMRQVYRTRGYLDAVVELDHLEFSDDRARVRVHVVIDEGVPYKVSSVKLRAVERIADPANPKGYRELPTELVLPEGDLLELLTLKPGMDLVESRISTDERALRLHYGERGYLSHPSLGELNAFQFRDPPEIVYDVENKTVEVTYVIVQGIQRWIREVRFSGATHTQDRVMRRQVSILEGERADLREIQNSLRRITSSGYFSDERNPLDHRDPYYRFIPTNDPEWVDLEFVVQEGRVVDFEISGGVSSNSGLFGILSLGVRNFDATDTPESFWGSFGEFYRKEAFHGAGQRLDLQFSPGTEIDFTRIYFQEPDIFKRHFDRWSFDAEFLLRERRFRDYDEDRERYRVRFGRQFLQDWTFFIGYAWQKVGVDDLDDDVANLPAALVDQEGTSEFSALLLDLRYRNLDRFLDPHDGQLLQWNNEIHGGLLGEDHDFVKSELALDYYLPIGPSDQAIRSRFLLSAGLGVAEPYGDSETVPYTERFFIGGLSTLRGFAFRGVGPNVDNTPIGGQTMLRGTIEYRHPLHSITRPGGYDQVEMLRGHVFLDAGILDEESFSLDADELRASVGFGIGLSFPIPLVFNFGFPIEKGDGDRRQTFSFTISTR